MNYNDFLMLSGTLLMLMVFVFFLILSIGYAIDIQLRYKRELKELGKE